VQGTLDKCCHVKAPAKDGKSRNPQAGEARFLLSR
jgi:hypothetical protein